jgi:hypothetical protein
LRYPGRNTLGSSLSTFLLPAFVIGLASFIAILEGLDLVPGREIYFCISWLTLRGPGVRPREIAGAYRAGAGAPITPSPGAAFALSAARAGPSDRLCHNA